MHRRLISTLFFALSCFLVPGTAFAGEKTAVIKGSIVNVRTESNAKSKKLTNLFSNTEVTVSDPVKNESGESWYPVKTAQGTGYVRADFIKFPVQYQREESFENSLNQQGFPESYKQGLRALHAEFPNWQFRGFKTNLDWNTVLDGEMEGTGSLVDKNAISSWKSTDNGKYDWNTGTWPGFDGPSWVGASRALTAYYMDPRNFFDESYVFQFLVHNYNPEEQNAEGLNAILKGSFMASTGGDGSASTNAQSAGNDAIVSSTVSSTEESGEIVSALGPGEKVSASDNGQGSTTRSANGIDYSGILLRAAEATKQNPYVLAAMILQEQGKGTSGSISGASGLYNYFNVGAYAANGMGAVERGIWYAGQSGSYGRPWNSPEKSIQGGAQFFAENYLNAGQNTFYLKKWNVQGSNLYKHQYMTNVQGAAEEGAKLSKAYTAEMKKKTLSFSIPIYENMPEKRAVIPTGTGSPNNRLSLLTVSGYTLSTAFNGGNQNYSLTIPKGTKSITIAATAVDGKAKVSGAGVQSIEGKESVVLSVKAENGDERNYNIKLNFSDTASQTATQSGGESGVGIVEVGKGPLS